MVTLRRLRKRRKLTQEQLAQLTGIKQTTISTLELGKVGDPRVSTVRKLARALHVPEVVVLRALTPSRAPGVAPA